MLFKQKTDDIQLKKWLNSRLYLDFFYTFYEQIQDKNLR